MVEEMSAFFSEKKTQLVFLIAAEFKFLSAGHYNAMMPVKPGLHFADTLQVDDRGAMNAHEFVGIKLCFHLIHVAADQMRCCTAVKTQVVAFGFNPVEVADIEEEEAPLGGNRNSFQIVFLLADLAQQPGELMIGRMLLPHFHGAPGAKQGVAKSVFRKRLQQIVESMGFKRLQRVAIVGRYKDGHRHLVFSHGANHVKTIELGELNIEEDQVRFVVPNGSHGGFTVAAFATNLKFRKCLEVFANAASRQGFVIDNERFVFHGLPAFDARTLVTSPPAGRLNFTATPPLSRFAISKEYWLP